MANALIGRMPRCLPDHRSREAKRLREVYLELIEKYPDAPGPARRIALMAAEGWLQYMDLGLQLASAKKNKRSAVEIRRLKKERRLAAGHYLGGLREVQAMIDRDGNKTPDLARKIQRAQQQQEGDNGR